MANFPLVPFVLACFLAFHGFRKKSLSPSGAVAAFIIGFVMLSVPLRAFGISLLVFYFLGSAATKYGKQLKAQLEDGYHEAGYRTAWQVLCNSFAAFISSVLWSVYFAPDSVPTLLLRNKFAPHISIPYTTGLWCPISLRSSDGLSRALLFATLGHFACCLGDTLASELGILSRRPPILITTLRPVPPGTNGGMSLIGTIASVAGGLMMGFTLFASLVIENYECRKDWSEILVNLLLWGGLAGGIGSLTDSLLGATVQVSRYSSKTKRILSDEARITEGATITVVSGLNILSNNQVNLVSSLVTALLLARFG